MKYAIVYTDSIGESHFRDAEISLHSVNFAPPAPPVMLSEYLDVGKMVFFSIPAGWFGDWHPTPKKQFFCCLQGQAEIVVGDGETRCFRAGDVFFLEDTSGRGHTTRVISSDAFVAVVVQLAAET
jgi:quercetin dioxygenase-like cupin family protein